MTSSAYRVTLQFSTSDPEQKEVIKLLKEKGRKKSIFITKAVKFYLENENKVGAQISKEEIKDLIREVLAEMEISPQKEESAPSKLTDETKEELKEEPTSDEAPTEEDVDDFLDGLNAWGQENY